jgi:hypothetical protein
MNRRALLCTVGGVGASLAGCLGTAPSPADSTDGSPTTSTGTPRPLPCPDPDETGEVEVPPWPAAPDSLSKATAIAYTREFERVYTVREAARNERFPVRITVDVDGPTDVTRADGGWVVHFTVTGPAVRYRPDSDSTETRHSDPPMYGASYFAGEETTLRTVALDPVDPRRVGREATVVTCTPE